MNKEIIKEIALQAGGSLYPDVGGETLEKFAELLIKECIITIAKTPAHCANTTYQLGIVECTIAKSVEALEEKFGIPHYEIENETSSRFRSTSRISGY